MLVISAGMYKSGSAYIYNLINDILVYSGGTDARGIKEKYDLDKVMKYHNNNIGKLNRSLLIKLYRMSVKEGRFAVKTHFEPSTRLHDLMLKLGLVKTIYIYRDPRDVLLSAQDHGKKIRESGEDHTFANIIEFDDTLQAVKKWTKIYDTYKSTKGVFCVKYEDLINSPNETIKSISSYLKIKLPEEAIENILKKYDRKNPKAEMRGLHFNKAITERYKDDLTPEQLEKTKSELGDIIVKMGYELGS